MKKDFRHSMIWLHTWAGLVFCWLLYFMFVTGTLGYLDSELDSWMKPELSAAEEVSLETDLSAAVTYLQAHAADAERWFISPANHRDNPQLRVSWRYPRDSEKSNGRELINRDTGEELHHRETAGGQTLYRMHYRLHYLPSGWGFRLVGIFTLAMFIALLTGVVAHRKLFKDFFSFRPQKGKTAWLDMHNLSSIASLPFQLMITYSGLIFAISTWMPFVGVAAYDFDVKSLRADINEMRGRSSVKAAGESANLVGMDILSQNIEASINDGALVRFIEIKNPNDRNAKIFVNPHLSGPVQEQNKLQFDGRSGKLESSKEQSGALQTRNVFINLHEGLFAGPALRLLYILSGILGTLMVATGAIYYAQKRKRPTHALSKQQMLVNIVNGGTIIGLPISICIFMISNRLLAIELDQRADWEVHSMFLAWLASFVLAAFWVKDAMWKKLTLVLSIALFTVPIVNFFSTNRGLGQSSWQNDTLFVATDVVMLSMAAISLLLWAILSKKEQRQQSPIRSSNAHSAVA
ncbi:PepSY-associated TM helix domain-containing protein [uncultured Pseudoteredinibacter sp.]|uniref:PepSY-associated TM helix domain-containing protein n=1 Tax=uncultured Pseudoteredinibacter sp. TaxID=1641701 RepID=UPI002627C87D|nr:PepSY-associated TM helix domain-containing protein [uncultured Pseudoteredinibacter sp.]